MFSILIPTFNNVKYLELCINSIKKNSNIIIKSLLMLILVMMEL